MQLAGRARCMGRRLLAAAKRTATVDVCVCDHRADGGGEDETVGEGGVALVGSKSFVGGGKSGSGLVPRQTDDLNFPSPRPHHHHPHAASVQLYSGAFDQQPVRLRRMRSPGEMGGVRHLR